MRLLEIQKDSMVKFFDENTKTLLHKKSFSFGKYLKELLIHYVEIL
jgi:hypothetical protein